MGTIWIRDIKGGLDTRRMPETLPGGTAIRARDGHLNRGGEFEQRPAFVEEYVLPEGATVGLGVGKSGIYVFGSGAAPAMPKGVQYQRLQHPDGVTPLFRVLSTDLFASKIYAVAEFVDGSQYHFYNGTRITDWQDGRARAAFRVTGGGIQAAIAATGSFQITSGTANVVNTVADIKLNGVSIISVPVVHTGNNATTAAAVASAINAFVSVPNYTAVAVGAVVNITASDTGTTPNGYLPVLTLQGDVLAANIVALAGGAISAPSQLAGLTINGVDVLGEPVDWTTSHEETAEAIALQINTYASEPDYIATVVGDKVNLIAADAGIAPNGFAVAFSLVRNLVLSPSVGVSMAGGLAPGSVFQSGTFAKTIGSKVYAAAGPNLNFSGIKAPTGWQVIGPNVGAGFIDMSTEAAGSEVLQAIAKYLQFIAVFAERVIQIWYVDPDPSLNKQTQVMNNTGTLSPRSVTQFGDNDLFYLDESGLRSLRARDSSNSAATTDIGIPIDPLIVAKLQSLSLVERNEVVGLIEPSAGRFWLIFPDEIFVFNFFPGSKISAWTTYTPAVNGVPFSITNSVVFKKKVYLRSGDKIYVYGGLNVVPEYDATEPQLWTPYLDANTPAEKKQFKSIDLACVGSWEVRAAMDPSDQTASDKIATIDKTTYGHDAIPFDHETTHVSLRFIGKGSGFKKISAAAIHFTGEMADVGEQSGQGFIS